MSESRAPHDASGTTATEAAVGDATARRAHQTPEGGAPLAGADPVYLRDPVLDATVRIVVELAAQVWVERERRLALEALLESRGVITSAAVESFKADPARAEALKAERARYIEDVFRDLRRIPMVVDPT